MEEKSEGAKSVGLRLIRSNMYVCLRASPGDRIRQNPPSCKDLHHIRQVILVFKPTNYPNLQEGVVNDWRRRCNLKDRRPEQNISIGHSRVLTLAGDEDVCLAHGNSWDDSLNNSAVDGAFNGSDAQAGCEGDEAAGRDVGCGGEGVG